MIRHNLAYIEVKGLVQVQSLAGEQAGSFPPCCDYHGQKKHKLQSRSDSRGKNKLESRSSDVYFTPLILKLLHTHTHKQHQFCVLVMTADEMVLRYWFKLESKSTRPGKGALCQMVIHSATWYMMARETQLPFLAGCGFSHAGRRPSAGGMQNLGDRRRLSLVKGNQLPPALPSLLWTLFRIQNRALPSSKEFCP